MSNAEAADRPDRIDASCRRVAWVLAGLILLSFALGMIMYLPAEQRAQKFEQMKQKYEAKQPSRLKSNRQAAEDAR